MITVMMVMMIMVVVMFMVRMVFMRFFRHGTLNPEQHKKLHKIQH
jgi:hypothetical protein